MALLTQQNAILIYAVEEFIDIQPNPTTVWPTWKTLKKEIEGHFQINVLKEEAYKKIAIFKQGDMPIETFT